MDDMKYLIIYGIVLLSFIGAYENSDYAQEQQKIKRKQEMRIEACEKGLMPETACSRYVHI